jgi:amidase
VASNTFITRLEPGTNPAVRVAVNDLIDVIGVPTTAGSRVVADGAQPAVSDAACLAGTRAAGATIVGKVNLHELALGATGINAHFGTPTNPLDDRLVPGGSSSGSAVAVATDEADIAFGTDTGGSVRIPSACCGTVGLKTTHGRVSLAGVWPLAPSLDTVGPMARDVAGVVAGMQLLEPGFMPDIDGPLSVGRFRVPGTDPAIDSAIDNVLASAECDVIEVNLEGWKAAQHALGVIITAEAFASDHHLLDRYDDIDAGVARVIEMGRAITSEQVARARATQRVWQEELDAVFARCPTIAMPTLIGFPPRLDHHDALSLVVATGPGNLAGIPGLALPIPALGGLPASLQLVGPRHSEAALLAAGFLFEAAARQVAS